MQGASTLLSCQQAKFNLDCEVHKVSDTNYWSIQKNRHVPWLMIESYWTPKLSASTQHWLRKQYQEALMGCISSLPPWGLWQPTPLPSLQRLEKVICHRTAFSVHSLLSTLWHNRLAHICESSLRKALTTTGNLKTCHPCKLCKAIKKNFDSKMKPVSEPGEKIHSDLYGPLPLSQTASQYPC